MSTAVSVVDFKDCGLHVKNPNSVKSSVLEKISEDLYNAFTTTGVCYIINHGVPQSMIDKMFSVSEAFFTLPVEEKEKCARPKKATYTDGWTGMGREFVKPVNGIEDLKECFDFMPRGNDTWPASIPNFKTAHVKFYDVCKQLSERVLLILAIALKLEDRSLLKDCHSLIGQKGNQTLLRNMYYPSVPKDGSVKPDQVRCVEHVDWGSFTLLFQDSIGGLELQNTEGVYVPASPMSGAVVVNIGALMQHWTADKFIATKHRVVIPEEELKKNQSRQSVAFFVNPNDHVIIKCLDGSEKYEPLSTYDYMKQKMTSSYL